MLKSSIILGVLFILIGCKPVNKKWNIKGNWYGETHRSGNYDTARNYREIYIDDSLIRVDEEIFTLFPMRRYYIKGDSIYICFIGPGDCEYIPVFEIKKLEHDTLWLKGKFYSALDVFWVRFPSNEKGWYDYSSSKARDSVLDYDRRRYKYFKSKNEYDSALKAGTWEWANFRIP